MRVATLALVLFVAAAGTGCREQAVPHFAPGDFELAKYGLVLAFDLRADSRPVAGLSIDQRRHKGDGATLLVLPFPVSAVELDFRIAATAGQYRDFTLISYAVRENASGTVGLGVLPVMGSGPEGLVAIETIPEAVCLRRAGLEREFLYRYGAMEDAAARVTAGLPGVRTRFPDAVAVALPHGARGREIRDGKTEIPPHLEQTTIARFYSAVSTDASVKALQIRYELPVSANQKRLADSAGKLVGALVVPLIGLIFLPRRDTTHPRLRKGGIALLVVLQLAVLAAVVGLWLRSSTDVQAQLLLDVPIALVGAAAAGLVLWSKK
jgi:hypothetical protein